MPSHSFNDGLLGNRVFICDRKKHFKNVCDSLPFHAGREDFADAYIYCYVNTANSGVQFAEAIPVQRSMLCTVSPFFANIFTEAEKTRPGHDANVFLEDTNAATMWRLIELLYKGWNSVNAKQKNEVLALCSRFGIKINVSVDGNANVAAKSPMTPKAKESKKPEKTAVEKNKSSGEKGKAKVTSAIKAHPPPTQQQPASPTKSPAKQPKPPLSSPTPATKDSKKRKMSVSQATTSSAGPVDSPKKTKKETPAKNAKNLFTETKNFTSPLRKCPHCDTVTFSEDTYKTHLASHSVKKENKPKKEKPSEKLENPDESKGSKKSSTIRCYFCTNTYANGPSLTRHLVMNHFKAQVEQSMASGSLQCLECSYLAPSRSTLIVHVGLTHKKLHDFCSEDQLKGIKVPKSGATNNIKTEKAKPKKKAKQAPAPLTPPSPANADESGQEEEDADDDDENEDSDSHEVEKSSSSFANYSNKQQEDSSSSSSEEESDDD